jgi:magnesium chelatase family protein
MFRRLSSVAFRGLEALVVEVEVDCVPAEKLLIQIVGLPDSAVKESRERVVSALRHAGVVLSALQITVNLAPSDIKKEGTLFDLPIAAGIAIALGRWKPPFSLEKALFVGELGLQGDLRPMRGALGTVLLAKEKKFSHVFLPGVSRGELSYIPEVEVVLLKDLKSLLKGEIATFEALPEETQESDLVDLKEIVGQEAGKRALEIAAAGGHNLLFKGPPGSGKSLLAKSLPSLLPPLKPEAALEVKRIWSLAGLKKEGDLPPFRSPHHTISYAGLIGGGSKPRPGEVSLAHQGILFLDEIPEFSRQALEVLRQPLEDHHVTITRSEGSFTFPSRFLCIGAMNPCPCGYFGHPDHPCKDTVKEIDRYQKKISGPLLDRFDMVVEIPALAFTEMRGKGKESSAVVRERVQQARHLQESRNGANRFNHLLKSDEIKQHVALTPSQQSLLEDAVKMLHLSMRSLQRLLKVTRTIADLENKEEVADHHLLEAISYRSK